MRKYKVTAAALVIRGVKYRRGDVIETDQDYGTRVEPYVEPAVAEPVKPKRRRRTKAEMEAASDEQDS